MTSSCIICGNASVERYRLFDDRYGYPGKFPLYKCRSCGHGMLKGEFTEEKLKELYTDYYPRSTYNVDDHRPFREVKGFVSWLDGNSSSAFRHVPKNVRVLDIGCGFGETLGYYESRGCDAYGVEADDNIIRVAERYGYKVHVGLFDPSLYEPGFFDYVVMDQVIEHVTDPVNTIKGIATVLKPGGTAILSTPNAGGWGARTFGKRWINLHVPYHLQHFSHASMKVCAAKAALVLDRCRTVTNSEWLYYQWIHLISFPREGEPSWFWSLKGRRGAKRKILLYLIYSIHKTRINHMITRFFDAIGMGDNFIFVLRKPK